MWRAAVGAYPRDAWVLRHAAQSLIFDDDERFVEEIIQAIKCALRERRTTYAFFADVFLGLTTTRGDITARHILEIMFDAFDAEPDRAQRYHMIWNMRELASYLRREDVLAPLRHADAAAKRWRMAMKTESTDEAAHASREAEAHVAQARSAFTRVIP